jgi:hypothetical protein
VLASLIAATFLSFSCLGVEIGGAGSRSLEVEVTLIGWLGITFIVNVVDVCARYLEECFRAPI